MELRDDIVEDRLADLFPKLCMAKLLTRDISTDTLNRESIV
jgi:hypothetical protein